MPVRYLLLAFIILVSAMPGRAGEQAMTIAIDCAHPQGTISPYIYGQFIEHLGRCIYGGIWAQMLEDRKFFHPVGHAPSPWRRLGGQAGWSLTMDYLHPYVGRWAVEVALDQPQQGECGLVHPGLGVVAGKQYLGYALLAGERCGPVRVSLAWGEGSDACQVVTIPRVTSAYRKYAFRFRAGATSDQAALRIGISRGLLRIGALSLMPADNVHGLRADTLALLRQLNSPLYRWPGGNFVSGYDWRVGLGPQDRRPPFRNPAWEGIDQNDFGIDEFMAFCQELRTEPLVVVNTGEGSPKLAAEQVEYCRGPATSTWGRVRAQNGHPEPYAVRWWGIGNEMYGDWQLGHMPLADYVIKHNETVRAMRRVDPAIKTVAVGDSSGSWSEGMLAVCADYMTALSEHFYVEHKDDLRDHAAQPALAVRGKADRHRHYLATLGSLQGKRLPIALDEWNYGWPGVPIYGELGVRYQLRDALGIARGLHEVIRQHDLFLMANFAQTVNVIGAIKTTKTFAEFDTVGLPLALYRNHFGSLPLPVPADTGDLDVVAALTPDRRTLTLGIVNPTPQAAKLALELAGFAPAGAGRLFTITGPHADAYNEPGKPPLVAIQEQPLAWSGSLEAAPLSINLVVLPGS